MKNEWGRGPDTNHIMNITCSHRSKMAMPLQQAKYIVRGFPASLVWRTKGGFCRGQVLFCNCMPGVRMAIRSTHTFLFTCHTMLYSTPFNALLTPLILSLGNSFMMSRAIRSTHTFLFTALCNECDQSGSPRGEGAHLGPPSGEGAHLGPPRGEGAHQGLRGERGLLTVLWGCTGVP